MGAKATQYLLGTQPETGASPQGQACHWHVPGRGRSSAGSHPAPEDCVALVGMSQDTLAAFCGDPEGQGNANPSPSYAGIQATPSQQRGGPRQSAGGTGGTNEGTYVLCIVWKSCCPSRETPALIAYAWLIFSSFSVRALLASWRGDKERGSSAEHRQSGHESSKGTQVPLADTALLLAVRLAN